MTLDRPRVLADEMAGVGLDGGARGREMPPGAGFAQPDDAGVGLDLDKRNWPIEIGVTAVIFMGAPIERPSPPAPA